MQKFSKVAVTFYSFILHHGGTYIFSYILIEITANNVVLGEDAFVPKGKGDVAQW